jgi:hypothetical protein
VVRPNSADGHATRPAHRAGRNKTRYQRKQDSVNGSIGRARGKIRDGTGPGPSRISWPPRYPLGEADGDALGDDDGDADGDAGAVPSTQIATAVTVHGLEMLTVRFAATRQDVLVCGALE